MNNLYEPRKVDARRKTSSKKTLDEEEVQILKPKETTYKEAERLPTD